VKVGPEFLWGLLGVSVDFGARFLLGLIGVVLVKVVDSFEFILYFLLIIENLTLPLRKIARHIPRERIFLTQF